MNDYPCSLSDRLSLIIYLRKLVGVSVKAFNPSKLKFYWSLSDSEMPSGTWTYNTLNLELILEEVPAPKYTVTMMFRICVKQYPVSGTCHSSAELPLAGFASFCVLLLTRQSDRPLITASLFTTAVVVVYVSVWLLGHFCQTASWLVLNWRPGFFRATTISHGLES